MGNSAPAPLPEITNFRNVPDKPMRGIDPARMIPLANKTSCQCCSTQLPLAKRHNCRGCGEVICDACSAAFDVLPDNSTLQKKVRVCKKCVVDKRFISCVACSEVIEAKDYSLHEKELCKERIIKCSLCNNQMKAKEEQNHQSRVCTMRLVTCTEGCATLVAFSKQEDHLQNHCAKRAPCPHGCNMVIVPSKVASHTPSCICRPVTCLACAAKVPNNRLDNHSRNDCPERVVSCTLGCGLQGLKAKNLTSHCTTTCTRRPVPCSDRCGQQIPLHEMNKHLTESCAKRDLCQFGCNEMIAPSLFQGHRNVCVCRPATCSDCKAVVAHNKLINHKANECQERSVTCASCKTTSIKAKDHDHHNKEVCTHRQVHCPDGCGVVMPFSQLNDHLQNTCAKRAPCRLGCNTLVANSLFDGHAKICTCRPSPCNACKVEVPLNRMISHLKQDCAERIVPCSLGCEKKDIKAKDLSNHTTMTCIKRPVPCRDGCRVIVPLDKMKEHLQFSCANRVECLNRCGQLVAGSLFEEHNTVCTHRSSSCPDCHTSLSLNLLPEHKKNRCVERVVSCPQGCSEKNLKAKRLPIHMISSCKRRWMICSDGCSTQLMFCQLTKHLEDSCRLRELCSFGCERLIARSLAPDHSNSCPARRVSCPLCINSVQFNAMEDHKRNTCEERIVSCTLKCSQTRLRAKEIAHHVNNVCVNREVPCEEHCGDRVKFCNMESHRTQDCRSRVACPLSCGSLLPPSKLDKHKKDLCSRRKLPCSTCNQLYPYENLPQHQKVCPSRKISCSQCGQNITASEEKSHSLHSCQHRLVPCSEGCGRKIKFSEQDQHILRDCPNAKTLCGTCGEYVKNTDMARHDREECRRTCPQHHRLNLTMRDSGYKCDKCKADCNKGYSMCCPTDNYDLCTNCYPNSSIRCPHSCSASLTYRTVNEHMKTCPNSPMTCFYCHQSCYRSQLRNHQLNCPRRANKITVAQQTMTKFLRNMMSPRDRCSVVGFNDEYKILSVLGTENQAISALDRCVRECGGGTHLWDAMGAAVLQFVQTANRSVPWVLIVLTDGDDQGSRLTIPECASVLRLFNQDSTNFTFVIGLGKDVNEAKLKQVCSATGSFYLPAEESELLDLLLAMIAIQIVEGIRVDVASIGVDAAYARVQRAQQLGRKPVEFLLLVDISTSMKDK
eukprot:gene12692-13898_t